MKVCFFDKMALFSKKTQKKFASSEKSITFALAFREMPSRRKKIMRK
jgi:hypothetical protein